MIGVVDRSAKVGLVQAAEACVVEAGVGVGRDSRVGGRSRIGSVQTAERCVVEAGVRIGGRSRVGRYVGTLVRPGRGISVTDRSAEIGLIQAAGSRVVEAGVSDGRGRGSGRDSTLLGRLLGSVGSFLGSVGSFLRVNGGVGRGDRRVSRDSTLLGSASSAASAASSAASAASSGSTAGSVGAAGGATWARAAWTPVTLMTLADGTTPIAIAPSVTAASTTSRDFIVFSIRFVHPARPSEAGAAKFWWQFPCTVRSAIGPTNRHPLSTDKEAPGLAQWCAWSGPRGPEARWI